MSRWRNSNQPRTVRDVVMRSMSAPPGRPRAVYGVNEHLDNVDVLPLVEAADVVGFGNLALMENHLNCAGVVLYVQPVTHILTLSVHGEGLTVTDVVDEKRDKLLRELVRAVVV